MDSKVDEKNDILIIIQARFNSTRLPGKTLLQLDGIPVLSHVINRAKLIKSKFKVMCAIADDSESEKLVNICKGMNIDYFIGSENNVLERFYFASKQRKSKYIMRITSDCPLIDPFLCNKLIDYIKKNDFDYVSNVGTVMYPHGLDCEIFKTINLEKAYKNANLLFEKEHVTQNIRNDPVTKIGSLSSPYKNLENLRWTIDNRKDFEVLSKIFKDFKELITLNEFYPLGQAIINSGDKFYTSNYQNRYNGLINSIKREISPDIPNSKIDMRIIDQL
jgi:spore coat polysaccharide biosynthesis protein SpsF (cytidylyltransferase family)